MSVPKLVKDHVETVLKKTIPEDMYLEFELGNVPEEYTFVGEPDPLNDSDNTPKYMVTLARIGDGPLWVLWANIELDEIPIS